ncbi:MAG: response regulator transcription factor [Burkholderiaceae bacterium]|jgi:two-component system LytT family response regulator|nr:response regulator transcription factor [Burkholderiaceae bacterium]
MSIRAIIVDDEPLARRGLELRLRDAQDIEIARQCANGREALAAIAELHPDLMFLDIQMPGLSGFDVLAQVPQESLPMIVFVTAFDRFAIDAFEAHALDYLLKPVDDARLARALERVRAQWQQRQALAQREQLMAMLGDLNGQGQIEPESLASQASRPARRYATMLPIRVGRETIRLDVSTIDWIDAAGDYMCLHAAGQTHVLRATMRELEEMLDPQVFQRVHRSTIVNLARVRSLRPHLNGECFLKLQSGQEVKLSRSFRDKVELLLDRSGSAPATA